MAQASKPERPSIANHLMSLLDKFCLTSHAYYLCTNPDPPEWVM